MLAAVARGLRPSARPSFRRGRTITMGLKTGIVGLPNVGKSTLFNALTEDVNAEAANYPFCTIEPNVGVVSVPDARLSALSDIHDSEKTVATSLEFVDIAGLVKGASKGEGLGNQFLANIRECDAIVHVVRCFDDENVSHGAEVEASTRLQCEIMRQFRRKPFGSASRARRERSVRPKISRIDFDSTERARCEVLAGIAQLTG